MDQAWFEMLDIRRRPVSGLVWIPLRSSHVISEQGEYGIPGFSKEFFGLGSIAVSLDRRLEAEKLGWGDIGLANEHRSYAFKSSYKPADVYQYHDEDDFGIELVMEQSLPGGLLPVWHLHQDFVIAFGLSREGDKWLCPEEAFVEVARLKRDSTGRPVTIEVRAEFLKDYLAARRIVLRVSWYRERIVTVREAGFISWPDGEIMWEEGECRYEGRCWEVFEGGDMVGTTVGVFQVWRTDIDYEADVPLLEPESDENTAYESGVFERSSGPRVFMVRGEIWRNEWVEPASHSPRVRKDRVAPTAFFFTDATGKRESRDTLKSEDVGKYLWFRGNLIPTILDYRGSDIKWNTSETGVISLNAWSAVTFGVNKIGLVNVYACDVACLPDWQQHVWAGFSVTPEAGISQELLKMQMETRQVRTLAPESKFAMALRELDLLFFQKYGKPLLREHKEVAEILKSIHRFRGMSRSGILSLSKDIARLTADSIDVSVLNEITPPPKGERWGSIKSLEKFLASFQPKIDARKIMSPIVGVYDLRLGDAHLPSDKIEDAFTLIGVDLGTPEIFQSFQIIESVANALQKASDVIRLGSGGEK